MKKSCKTPVFTDRTLIIMFLLIAIMPAACRLQRSDHSQPDEAVFQHKLDSALRYIENVSGKDGIKKTVVLKDGIPVYEGTEIDVVQNTWSCTKSFTSTVLGILISQGKCSLDQKVHEFLPELKEHYPELTFRHFATMTSGYRAIGDEPRGDYTHGPSRTPHLPAPNPLFPPGTEYRYWDSAMNMFAYALTKVAGEPIKELFKREIANRIGMNAEKWDWRDYETLDGNIVNGGAGNNGWGIMISASEFAKFGQLMLQEGSWEGQTLLPKDWVKEATSPQVEKLTGDDVHYGLNWLTAGALPDAPKGTFISSGFNNNRLIVIPAWNLVISRLGLDGSIEIEKWNDFIKILGEAFDPD
jgi:CubicO group peptidase (beta-lactamase class C family)